MANEKKQAIVDALEARLKKLSSVVMVDYNGLSVSDQEKVRTELRGQNIDFQVVKNRLLRIAAANAGIPHLPAEIAGQTAIAIGYDDVISAPKTMIKMAKKYEAIKIKGGFMFDQYLTSRQVDMLSRMPGRQELYGQVVGVMAASLRSLLNVMNGNSRNLVQLLGNYRDQKQAA